MGQSTAVAIGIAAAENIIGFVDAAIPSADITHTSDDAPAVLLKNQTVKLVGGHPLAGQVYRFLGNYRSDDTYFDIEDYSVEDLWQRIDLAEAPQPATAQIANAVLLTTGGNLTVRAASA